MSPSGSQRVTAAFRRIWPKPAKRHLLLRSFVHASSDSSYSPPVSAQRERTGFQPCSIDVSLLQRPSDRGTSGVKLSTYPRGSPSRNKRTTAAGLSKYLLEI